MARRRVHAGYTAATGTFVLTQSEISRHRDYLKAIAKAPPEHRARHQDILYAKIRAEREAHYRSQSEQARRSSETTARSQAVKQRAVRAKAATEGKAVGTISKEGQAQVVQDSVARVTTLDYSTPARQEVVEIKDSEGKVIGKTTAQSDTEIKYGAVLAPDTRKEYKIGLKEELTFGEKRDFPSPLNVPMYTIDRPKFEPKLQDYPRPFTIGEYLRGVYEGGVKPLAQIIVTPKPIFTDMLHGLDPDADKKRGEILSSVVKKQEELIKPGPSAAGAYIEQLVTGKPLTGTGEGAAYDLGSFSFDVGLVAAPTKKIPLPIKGQTFKFATSTGKVRTIRVVEVGIGKRKEVITTVDGKILYGGTQRNISRLGIGEFRETIGKSAAGELTTQSKLGQKIIYERGGLEQLEQAGKVLPRDVEGAGLTKEAADIIKTSAKKVPKDIRQKAETIPDKPLSGLTTQQQQTVVREGIIPKFPRVKGTLAETVQLERDLIKPVKGVKVGEKTTHDVDADFANLVLGSYRAKKTSKESLRLLKPTAQKGERFAQQPGGTNITFQPKGGKPDVVLNILTKKDVKTGYLQSPEKPFGIKLKDRPVKVLAAAASKEKGTFESIEQQAMNRIESFQRLQGPGGEKFKGGEKIPYLKEGLTDVQRTEKGFTIISDIHRLKDPVKLVTQDFAQISRNLKAIGYEKEGRRLEKIGGRLKELYPELDWGAKQAEPLTAIGSSAGPSKLSMISKEAAQITGSAASATTLKKPTSQSGKSITSKISSKSATRPITSKAASRSITSRSSSTSRLSQITGSPASVSKISQARPSKPSISKPSISRPSISAPSTSSPGSPGSPARLGSRGSASSSLIRTHTPSTIRTDRVKPGIIINITGDPEKGKDRPAKRRYDFLGSTHVAEVTGFRSKKEDIIYGKRTAKIAAKDVRKSARGTFGIYKRKRLKLQEHKNLITKSPNKKLTL